MKLRISELLSRPIKATRTENKDELDLKAMVAEIDVKVEIEIEVMPKVGDVIDVIIEIDDYA